MTAKRCRGGSGNSNRTCSSVIWKLEDGARRLLVVPGPYRQSLTLDVLAVDNLRLLGGGQPCLDGSGCWDRKVHMLEVRKVC